MDRDIFVCWDGDTETVCAKNAFLQSHPVSLRGLAEGMSINLTEPEAKRLLAGLKNILLTS